MSRNRQADGLEPPFDPASIAVVGASNTPGKMGNLFMRRVAAGMSRHDNLSAQMNDDTRAVRSPEPIRD
jgi:hypothetical protein